MVHTAHKQSFITTLLLMLGVLSIVVAQQYSSIGLVQSVISALTLFSVALILVRIIIGRMLLEHKSYMSTTILTLFIFAISGSLEPMSSLATLLIATSYYLYIKSFRRDEQSIDYIFRAGFVLGITPIIDGIYIPLFTTAIAACIIFRRSLKELILTTVAYLLPTILYSYGHWLCGSTLDSVVANLTECVNQLKINELTINDLSITELAFLAVYTTTAIASLIVLHLKQESMRNSAKRIYSWFTFVLFVSLLLPLFPSFRESMVTTIAIPFAIIIPAMFDKIKGWHATVAYWLLIASSIASMIYNYWYI